MNETMLSKSRIAAFFCWALLCAGFPGVGVAQSVDLRLRGITDLQVSVTYLPDVRGGGPCLIASAGLEERAAATLRSAGLQAVTGEETVRRAMAQLRLSQAEVRAIQEGRSPPAPSPAESRWRAAEHQFLQNIHGLSVVFHATPLDVDGRNLCALAISANFLARAVGTMTPAGTNRPVRALLHLWGRGARSFVVGEGEVSGAVTKRLDMLLNEFSADWRLANGR
jgi:hypothetical protein